MALVGDACRVHGEFSKGMKARLHRPGPVDEVFA